MQYCEHIVFTYVNGKFGQFVHVVCWVIWTKLNKCKLTVLSIFKTGVYGYLHQSIMWVKIQEGAHEWGWMPHLQIRAAFPFLRSFEWFILSDINDLWGYFSASYVKRAVHTQGGGEASGMSYLYGKACWQPGSSYLKLDSEPTAQTSGLVWKNI